MNTSIATSNATAWWQQRNYNTIQKIYNITVHPNNQAFLQKGFAAIPTGLFNEQASGRITPIGNFSGFEETVEYFFGLTPPPQAPLYDTWTSATIVSFASGCPEVASTVVYGATTGVNANASTFGQRLTTIKQIAFWRFDSAGAVLQYDIWLPSLALYTNNLYGGSLPPASTIATLCGQTEALCTGSNTQYSSTDSCIETLTAKPFGSWDEIWGDNIVCRMLHILLARLRPDVHCPHVGPTGGGKCVDVNYNDVYFDDQALFGAPAGRTFVCPNSPWLSKVTSKGDRSSCMELL